jgi:hypothetical protein
VPVLARALASLGIRIDLALVLVVITAGVGFYLALRSLAFLFYKQDDQAEIMIILLVLIGMLIFYDERLPYDLMTACLFTLVLQALARSDHRRLLIVFTLACLNRETAFLLIIFHAAVLFLRQDVRQNGFRVLTIQTFIFCFVQLYLHLVFSENPGSVAWIEPKQNLLQFMDHPHLTILHGSITSLCLLLIYKDWTQKPYFLRLALISMGPPLVLMYLAFGQAFEIRIFWEIYPILGLLLLPTLCNLRNGFLYPRVL